MDTAFLITDVPCPGCGVKMLSSMRIQWGACPRDAVYRSSEAVEWLTGDDGAVVLPYRLSRGRWNCGDPALSDVVVKDPTLLGGPLTCPGCKSVFEGAAVAVRGGRFEGAFLYAKGALPGNSNAFERLPDGSLRPLGDDSKVGLYPL